MKRERQIRSAQRINNMGDKWGMSYERSKSICTWCTRWKMVFRSSMTSLLGFKLFTKYSELPYIITRWMPSNYPGMKKSVKLFQRSSLIVLHKFSIIQSVNNRKHDHFSEFSLFPAFIAVNVDSFFLDENGFMQFSEKRASDMVTK